MPGWVRPSNWYLTGFLVPRGAPVEHRGDADVDDEPEVAESGGLGDDSTEDRRAAKKGFFPSSMGLSFLVSEEVEAVDVLVRWGDYRRVEAASGDPDGGRDEQGDEAGAGRAQPDTSGGRSGDGTGDAVRGDGKGGDRRRRIQPESSTKLVATHSPHRTGPSGPAAQQPAARAPNPSRTQAGWSFTRSRARSTQRASRAELHRVRVPCPCSW